MLQNKETFVQIKEKYIYFITDSVRSLTLQVGIPQTWMGVAHVVCSTMALKVHICKHKTLINIKQNINLIKKIKKRKFIRIITVIVSNKTKRALFQYIGKQPMKCKKSRFDPMSVKQFKDDINVKS